MVAPAMQQAGRIKYGACRTGMGLVVGQTVWLIRAATDIDPVDSGAAQQGPCARQQGFALPFQQGLVPAHPARLAAGEDQAGKPADISSSGHR